MLPFPVWSTPYEEVKVLLCNRIMSSKILIS
uniref:Uncharacterized protein n=1 Tax=Arundo donax TaxID=35708 RepID=A0A0A9SKK2_ARUDO